MRITRDVFLVGMRHYKFTFPAGKAIASNAISLSREPLNPYDPNAIAVHIAGSIAGHVDKKSAATIAPLLDNGARWFVQPISPESARNASVPLKIVLTQDVVAITAPRPVAGKAAGIYRISVRGYHEVYIGQSRDINERLKGHWRELNNSVHSNPLMRRLWGDLGGANFEADLVEAAPSGLNDRDLTLWLESREDHWICYFDARGGVMNFDAVNPVWVGEDRVVARAERLEAQKIRGIVQEKRWAIQSKIDDIWNLKRPLLNKIDQESKRIKSTEGILGFIFASSEEKKRADQSRAIVISLKEELNNLDDALILLENEMRKNPLPPKAASRRLSRRSADTYRHQRRSI